LGKKNSTGIREAKLGLSSEISGAVAAVGEHSRGRAEWLSRGKNQWLQCEAPKIAKLVYNSNNYGLWYLKL